MYNPQAGGCELPVEDLVSKLQQRGAEVCTQITRDDDYKRTLEQPRDFILIAGGDGTTGKVAKKVFYKQVPIAICPFGSANNIAGSLVVDSALDAIFEGWQKTEFRQFSVGSIVWMAIGRSFWSQ